MTLKRLAEFSEAWDFGDGEYNPDKNHLDGAYADMKERWCGECGAKMKLKGGRLVCPKCNTVQEDVKQVCPTCEVEMKRAKFGYECPECGYRKHSERAEYAPHWYPDYALGYES